VEAIATLVSGNSVTDAGNKLAKRAFSKRFEKLLLEAADAYVAGYSSKNMAFLGSLGISAGAGAATWGSMKAWSYLNKEDEEEENTLNANSAVGLFSGVAAFVVFAIVFALINIVRRQRMFSKLAGSNMANQYIKFFTIPLVIMFGVLRVMIPLETATTSQIFLFALGASTAFVFFVRKFYFVFKLNDIEKDVFATLASVFEECKDLGSDDCSHEHAGFIDVFNKVKTVLQATMKTLFGTLDYAEISRELSKGQIFDVLS